MSTDKTIVLVTGANSGIGLETIIALSKSSPNYHLLLGARSLDKGNAALAQIQSIHNNQLLSPITPIQLDVTSLPTIESTKAYLASTFGRLDVLIQNAGVIVTHPCHTLENLRTTFETNVFGAKVVTDELTPLLQKSTNARVIYVSSEQGSITLRLDPEYPYKDVPGTEYKMSKAALNMLAACHRYDFRKWGGKVTSFNPGWCVTNLTGETGRKMRIEGGARSAEDPAKALVTILEGKRDKEAWEDSGILDLDAGVHPW
ncbi:putative dehydrogenase [Triangularia setosa]|uniref:Dehydrogenase n=1 Tax=Triangularia setosa TaxID=2587417 RepID=A0AAN6VVZ0_9PEZI|nr:putative dehydrogenase [Podospora setosa]